MTPQLNLYISELQKHVMAQYPYIHGQTQLALFLYHAEVQLDQAKIYLTTYVRKNTSDTYTSTASRS